MLQHFNEKNRNILININGKLLPRGEAGISPFDSTVQGGDAVWEGLRVYQGRIFKLTEHLDRLRGSARALAFDRIPSHEEITEQISSTLAANGMTDGVHIRLTLSRGEKITSGMDPRLNQSGPTLIVLAEHKPPVYDKGGLSLTTSSVRRFPPDCLDPKIHHCNLVQSILAKIEANAAGADDALMLDTRGFVAETNATHVFVVTSALTEVYRADEMFCTGTMGELAAVTGVDGRTIGDGNVGPTTKRLGDLFAELTAREGTPVC
ncbi:MAG: aminotransferase class IV [Planctomycetota bacterium]|jgi:branched-chain amino acid aminotransferase